MKPSKVTPMIQQYLTIKEKYPDSLLFYRMGDFFELFFEDAEVASGLLEITLTSRNKKDDSPIPMCGVPARAVKNYLSQLIDKGYKVAICDQIEDPAAAKGLVKRDVVRVITPGMIIEDEFLDKGSNNYILAVALSGQSLGSQSMGLSFLDISTATFRLCESDNINGMLDEILRISPSELIISEKARGNPILTPVLEAVSEKAITFLEDRIFDHRRCRQNLLSQFNTVSLEGFGCEGLKLGIGAAGAILAYVKDTQKQAVDHIAAIETYQLDNYLWVDDLSCRNLELLQNIRNGTTKGTLLNVIDHTVSAMGARLMKHWLRYPLISPTDILDRQDAVAAGLEQFHTTRDIRQHLKRVFDIERLGSKITMGHCNARDLVGLKKSLAVLPDLFQLLSSLKAPLLQWQNTPARKPCAGPQNMTAPEPGIKSDQIPEQESGIDVCGILADIATLIERAIREDAPPVTSEGGLVKPGYNRELDELIEDSRDAKGVMTRMEVSERGATGINSLKVRYNKVFGYYIEVPKSQAASVPPYYIRKQTLVNAERYITDELKTFETRVMNAQERRATLEYEIYQNIRSEITRHNHFIMQAAAYVARVDCLLGLADVALQNEYVRPEIQQSGLIAIEDGRHPVVEKMITAERFVPNNIRLDNEDSQVLIITGPNMAGKSTVLRQVALTVILAQLGSFVPAKNASISITDKIFTRVGALDNLSSGQSTFLVEMAETANILNNATDRSLLVLDEIGRGTSTFDGLSIAWAVAEYLHDLKGRGVKTLFATHYHELTELSKTKPRLKNFNIAVKEWNDEIIFLRKLVPGGTNRSYGIQVARLAGIPAEVIERSKQILTHIENGKIQIDDTPLIKTDGNDPMESHTQLGLFENPAQRIIHELCKINVAEMTPVEALNYLDGLQSRARNTN